MKDGYIKRQLNILSSLGLFYLIILALFSVPLMGALVVVLIKGVIDYQYLIIAAGCILFMAILFGIVKLILRIKHSLNRDGRRAYQYARGPQNRGRPVSISAFHGLLTLTYGGGPVSSGDGRLIDHPGQPMLPSGHEKQTGETDVVSKLKTLADLKKEGVIDETEFLSLKRKVISEMNSQS